MSNDPEQEYFSDGMTEEIISALAKLEDLKVISRTSVFYFKGEHTDLRTIGTKLNVENVLEGSIRKAGNKLRITAQLIKVADDTHLWTETYNRELEDVFAIQEEISNAIVDSLKIRLFGKEKETLVKTYTENTDAYESYIKGRYFYQSFVEGGMEEAIKYYEQAVKIDPGYAPAYSAIAEYYYYLAQSDQTVSKDHAYGKAMEAINKALKIDSRLPEAHSNLALIKMQYDWDWKGAEKAFEIALKLNPGLSKPHYDYTLYLAITGNTDKSILEARKAVELDPLSGIAHFMFGISLYYSSQLEQALQEFRQAREMAPRLLSAFVGVVEIYIVKEMFEEATIEINRGLKLFPKHTILLRQRAHIYAQKGEKDKAIEILDELLIRSEKEYVTPFAVASLYADMEEIEKAYEYLEEAYKNRDIWILYFSLCYHFDPRFEAFFKKIGL
jgi:serine/threonine-protein kinase